MTPRDALCEIVQWIGGSWRGEHRPLTGEERKVIRSDPDEVMTFVDGLAFADALDKQMVYQRSRIERELYESIDGGCKRAILGEEFIDEIIERIKRKQL